MTTYPFNLRVVHPSWMECLTNGLAQLNPVYLASLSQTKQWLPGAENIFNAFSLPLDEVNYVLFGESPYPRAESANGYAFWDAAVKQLWAPTGLSKAVNRATSLRNILKMLLLAEGMLAATDTGQAAIAKLDKQHLVQTNDALFNNLRHHGFLLLNATPVLQAQAPEKDARAWLPFIKVLLDCLLAKRPDVTFLLLGRIAKTINPLIAHQAVRRFEAEHPYNLSFITNSDVLAFFRPLHLLQTPN